MSREQESSEIPEDFEPNPEDLDYLEKEYSERAEDFRKKADLLAGVIFGLLFGILGNLAVQHWYAVFESYTPPEFLLWSNVLVVILLLGGIGILGWRLYVRTKSLESQEAFFKENMTAVRDIREKIKKRRKQKADARRTS